MIVSFSLAHCKGFSPLLELVIHLFPLIAVRRVLSEILSGNLPVDGGMRSPNLGGCAVRICSYFGLGFPQGLGNRPTVPAFVRGIGGGDA